MFEPISSVIPLLEDQGYKINDPWDIVDIFEKKLAKFAGSKYAVSVDNCTDGMFLCLKYLNFNGEITIPSNTWLSVPGMIMHTGCTVKFENVEWSGIYQLKPTTVYDGATRFTKDMYIPGSYQCVSFHHRKILKIGKGGMIFTDDKDAYEWFKIARYEGRNLNVPYDQDDHKILGWNMYMTPEQAARGILLFEDISLDNEDTGGNWAYKDLSGYDIFTK
jgi:dTDP-4-amino-4,6-dideoxygalactose transaminase